MIVSFMSISKIYANFTIILLITEPLKQGEKKKLIIQFASYLSVIEVYGR